MVRWLRQRGESAITRRVEPIQLDFGLPAEVCDGSAWYGAEMVDTGDWIEYLGEEEIAEVERAVHALEESRRI